MFDRAAGWVRITLVVVITCSMVVTPVAAGTTVPDAATRTAQQPSETDHTGSSDAATQQQPIRAESVDIRDELTQSVRVLPDDNVTLMPGRTYTFTVVTDVEARDGWEPVLKQSDVAEPALRINVSSEGESEPAITGIAAGPESYNATADDLSTQSHTVSTDSFAAGSTQRTLVRVRVPDDAEQLEIRASTGRDGRVDTDPDTETTGRYELSTAQDRWERLAALSRARAETAVSLNRTYDSLTNSTSVEAVVDRGMRNTFVETGLFAKDLIALRSGKGALSQLKSGGKQFEQYHDSLQTDEKFDGPWVGPIIQVQNRMWRSGLRQIQMNEVRRAGDSGAALERLARLAREEARAWENHDRERALQKLREQRDLLTQRDYPVDVVGPDGLPATGEPRFNLPQEARQQLREAETRSTWGDVLSNQTEGLFVGLKNFSSSQARSIETVALPMAREPAPSVALENEGAVRRQLAGDGPVTARFVVSNAEGAGATSRQGYLSLTYSESLSVSDVRQVEARSDAEQPSTATTTGEDRVVTKDGDREDIERGLTDVYEQFEPNETNVYEVTFEQSGSAEDAEVAYRAAFEPSLGDGDSFVRAPTDGSAGAQGWPVKTISAADAGEVVWTVDAGGYPSSQTVVDGTVYVGTDDGTVHALDARTGDTRWSASAGSTAPTVVDGTVYAAADDGTVSALDARTGDTEWTTTIENDVYTTPTVVDGTVYVGTEDPLVHGDDHRVVALDADSGDTQWEYGTSSPVGTAPTVYNGTVYVGTRGFDSRLHALDAETGDERWRLNTGQSISASATVADGTVYVGTSGGKLYAVDAVTGDEQWRFEVRRSASVRRVFDDIESSPTVFDGTVYFGSNEGRLYAVDADNGTSKWSVGLTYSITSSPTVANGTVYVGGDDRGDGSLYAFDAETGTKYWQVQASGAIRSSPIVVNGTVYAGTIEDDVYAISTDAERSAGSRVRLGTENHHDRFEKRGPTMPAGSNVAPTASLTYAPTEPAAGNQIVFNAFGASDPDGTIESYEWRFDGSAASDSVWGVPSTWYTTHAFETAGEHTVTLTVTDDDGETDSITETVTVDEADSGRVSVANTTVSIDEIERCDLTCRNVSYTIENPTEESISDLTTDVTVTSGDETLWSGESTVGDVGAGEQATVTDQIDLDTAAAATIRANDGRVTIEVTVTADGEDHTVTFEREF